MENKKTSPILVIGLILAALLLLYVFCVPQTERSTKGTDIITYVVDVGEGSTLNIRSGPGMEYPVVGSYDDEEKVVVVGLSGDWAKLDSGNWVCMDYLEAQQ